MVLIFGGAYQGKLDYCKETFDTREEDIRYCSEDSCEIDAGGRVIYGLERFVRACVKEGKEPADLLREHAEILKDKIFICTDMSQGVVPIDKQERAVREACGRMMVALVGESEEVHRVFCGIGERIK